MRSIGGNCGWLMMARVRMVVWLVVDSDQVWFTIQTSGCELAVMARQSAGVVGKYESWLRMMPNVRFIVLYNDFGW